MMTEPFQGQSLARVGRGDSYLLLAPEHGGRLVRWVHRGQDILYWPDNADWTRVAKVRGGNPLLFPFIGRHFVDGIAGRWRDGDGAVHELPQHGFARDSVFVLEDATDTAVTMCLTADDNTRAGYPFDFRFVARYRLLADGLEATLAVENRGSTPLPWYAGHHFYFALPHPQRAQATLALPRTDRVRQRADGNLSTPVPGAPSYRLDDPALQDTFHVLRAAGEIRLTLPGRALTFVLEPTRAAPWHAVTTWTEQETSDFYCVEPWLGLPNAIHHGQGLHWVAPGERQSATCRLLVR